MKKGNSILAALLIICSSVATSQTTPEKPATDACPSWNKKQPASKAEYFSYLSKRNKAQDQANFNTPKYQNYNAQPAPTTKRGPGTAAVKNTQQEETVKPVQPVLKKNAPDTQAKKPGIEQISPPAKTEASDGNKAPAVEPAEEQGSSDSSVAKEKKADVSKKKNTTDRHHKKHSFKKIHLRKKNAASCPDF